MSVEPIASVTSSPSRLYALRRKPYAFYESGSKDYRLCIVAIILWLAILVAYEYVPKHLNKSTHVLIVFFLTCLCIIVTLIAMIIAIIRLYKNIPTVNLTILEQEHASASHVASAKSFITYERKLANLHGESKVLNFFFIVCLIIVVMVGVCLGCAQRIVERADPVYSFMSSENNNVEIRFRVLSPVTHAKAFQYKCMAQAVSQSVSNLYANHGKHNGSRSDLVVSNGDASGRNVPVMTSNSNALLFSSYRLQVFGATHDQCQILQQGGVYEAQVRLKPSYVGEHVAQASISKSKSVQVVQEPSWLLAQVTKTQQSFMRLLELLDEEDYVLIPAVTFGVLGSDYYRPVQSKTANYAQKVITNVFRDIGLLHILVVSGGHFLLCGTIVRKLCAIARIPTRAQYCLIMLSIIVLGLFMYPSDSVLRAQYSLIIMSMAAWSKRAISSIQAWSISVMLLLIFFPNKSASIGFALSCGAVLGILLFAKPVRNMIATFIPEPIAQYASLSISAQVFATPLQMLFTNSIPLLAVVANICVAPILDLITLIGLAALACSMLSPTVSLILLQINVIFSKIIQAVVNMLGNIAITMPWISGVCGTILMLATNLTLMILLIKVFSRMKQAVPMMSDNAQRQQQWWNDTKKLFIHNNS
ncbi:MAG: ComEC/Rec2 family competence protein [Bifidobacteriaceae bacterium]|nr:ComEC/Rec2 family competence protein [Bifidobacteriaceae bacterium]